MTTEQKWETVYARFFPWRPAEIDHLTVKQFAGYFWEFAEKDRRERELWQALASSSNF